MQEFTRIIGSIHPTGISSANCFILRVVEISKGKASENQADIFV